MHNKHFTLKKVIKRSDLDDLKAPAVASHPLRVACYNAMNRHERKESERFKSFSYEELSATRIAATSEAASNSTSTSSGSKDESLEDSANLLTLTSSPRSSKTSASLAR
jgi:type I restriction enzyme M protein